jgi:DNA (cytosine-5)-methyltransferase 1
VSGKERLSNGHTAEYDWRNFPTQSPVLPGDDGLPAPLAGYSVSAWYKEFISGPGNAIVPQLAYRIFKAIEAYENT